MGEDEGSRARRQAVTDALSEGVIAVVDRYGLSSAELGAALMGIAVGAMRGAGMSEAVTRSTLFEVLEACLRGAANVSRPS